MRLSYDARWNSNIQNVDRAAARIKAYWEERLNKRARIELGLEDDNLSIEFEGLYHNDDTRTPEIGAKFPLTYSQLQDKVPVFDFINSRIASGGVPRVWILSTVMNTSPKRVDMDQFFADSSGDTNDQKQFRTFTYYLLKTNGLPENVINRYTRFMVDYKIGYTFVHSAALLDDRCLLFLR